MSSFYLQLSIYHNIPLTLNKSVNVNWVEQLGCINIVYLVKKGGSILLHEIQGENGLFALIFLKYPANFPCFEIIKHHVPTLKLDFLKIKFQCNSIF